MTTEGGGFTVVTLSAMKFDALIGILDHEHETRQPVEVDLSLEVEGFLDYRAAYDLVAGVMNAGHIRYIEDAANAIASKSLEHPEVVSVKVAVRKMRVALPGPLAFAEVAVERARE